MSSPDAVQPAIEPLEAAEEQVSEAPEQVAAPVQAPPWRRWEVGVYAALILATLVLRLWDLGSRAFHHDESLHALYSWYLAVGRGYIHNPLMHGPFQFHGTALIYKLFGDSDYTARLLPALFGTALVALPLLLRSRLGRIGTLATAALLALSPTMLYFSRFARNDIYMAVWALGLVAFLWRYLDTGQNRYLYLTALFLALLFATKETAYIVVVVLGAYLFILATLDIVAWLRGRLRLSSFSRAGVLLLLYVTLPLPMWAAGSAIFQGFLGQNLVLANLDPAAGPVGIPLRDGLYLAVGVTAGLFALSAAIGLRWRWRVWLLCAVIYYVVWTLLYTSFFTNMSGALTGVWQGMGYWIAQQGVGRGGQPWYYYFVIGSVYETLPLLFAIAGGIYYLRRGDSFTRFLVFWAVINLLLYTYATEKMPWLLVNVALPLIVLSGRFLSDLAVRVPWREVLNRGGLFILLGVPLLLFFLVRMVLMDTDAAQYKVAVAAVLVVAGIIGYLRYRLGSQTVLPMMALALAATLFLFSARSGIIATYGSGGDPNGNGDVPVEMLVYTQSSPDIPQVARQIRELAEESGQGDSLRISVDGTDGFAWPWAWYLRDYQAGYPDYSINPPTSAPDTPVVILNARNQSSVGPLLSDFTGSGIMEHRWWFPEVYRNVTPSKLWNGLLDRAQWQKVVRYLVYRDLGISLGALGSVDFYYYVNPGLAGPTS